MTDGPRPTDTGHVWRGPRDDVGTLRAELLAMFQEHDRRYEQRFIAQQEAIQAALLAQKEAVNAALVAADRAVIKAETASEKRFQGVNEFLGQLSDQAQTFLPRQEAGARFDAITEKIDGISKVLATLDGRDKGVTSSWAFATALIGMLLGLAGIALGLR